MHIYIPNQLGITVVHFAFLFALGLSLSLSLPWGRVNVPGLSSPPNVLLGVRGVRNEYLVTFQPLAIKYTITE